MEQQGEQLIRVPMEMVKIIPFFEGDARQLPLFIKKCEYILQSYRGGDAQNEYLFHVVTSRLGGEAANLVGERDQISTWDELKNVLSQHFGDPRSEECLAMELEVMKINRDESYLDFCHRIQHLRSVLFSKISENVQDINLKLAKHQIYDNTSLNVFLYNLPAYLVRLVRLRNINSLEEALKIVLEEQNFQTVYDSKNTKNNFNYNPRPQNFQNFNNKFNNNFNGPRPFSQPRQFNYQGPSTSRPFNNQNPNTRNPNFNSYTPNSSIQSRNNYRQNNSFNYSNNAQPGQIPNRSMQSQQRPASALYSNTQTPMSSNTDATMRTASSRRINFIDANYGDSNYDCANNNITNTDHFTNREEVENFFIMASPLPKK